MSALGYNAAHRIQNPETFLRAESAFGRVGVMQDWTAKSGTSGGAVRVCSL